MEGTFECPPHAPHTCSTLVRPRAKQKHQGIAHVMPIFDMFSFAQD